MRLITSVRLGLGLPLLCEYIRNSLSDVCQSHSMKMEGPGYGPKNTHISIESRDPVASFLLTYEILDPNEPDSLPPGKTSKHSISQS